jgi:hypothetical protein
VLIGARFARNSIVAGEACARGFWRSAPASRFREQVDELLAAGEAMIRRHAGAIAGFLELGAQAAVMARRR